MVDNGIFRKNPFRHETVKMCKRENLHENLYGNFEREIIKT